MVAIARNPQEVIASLTPADWHQLGSIVDDLNSYPLDLVDWVSPQEWQDDEWPHEVPLLAPVAERAVEFVYRSLTFRNDHRVGPRDIRRFAREFVDVLRKPVEELTIAEAITRISALAEQDYRVGDVLAYAFDSGEMTSLFERLLSFQHALAA